MKKGQTQSQTHPPTPPKLFICKKTNRKVSNKGFFTTLAGMSSNDSKLATFFSFLMKVIEKDIPRMYYAPTCENSVSSGVKLRWDR